MSTPVEIAVKAVGTAAAGRAISGVDGKTSKLGGTLRKVAAAGALAFGAAAVFGAKKLVDFTQAAIEDEAAQSALAQTLKKTTGATDKQVKSVEKWITKQGRLLGVTDDELRPALQRMAEGTGSVAKAQRMVSLAMDVSAGTGKSLKAVTEALLRAQNGSVGGLSRYGIATKDAAGETLSLNKVLDGMRDKFGGQAAKHADTMAGKMERLKLVMSEAGESIGAKFLPLLSDMVPALTDAAIVVTNKVVPAVGDMVDWLTRNKDQIGDTVGAIKDGLLPPLKTLGGVVADVARFLGGLPGPVQSFGAQAAAAALILPRLTGALGTARGAAGGLVGNLRNAETRTNALRSAARMAAGAGGMMLLADAANDAEGPMKELKDTAGKTAIAFAIGGPLLAGVVAFSDIVAGATGAGEDFGLSQDEMKASIDRVTESLNRQTGAFTKRTRNQLVADLGDKGILQTANDMNIALPKLVNATMQGSQGIQRFRTQYLSSLPNDQRTKFIALTETLFDMSDALTTGQRGFMLEREAAGKSGKAIQAHREKVRALANQYFILPKQVSTILKSVGADKSKQNVRELAKQYNLTPREIRTIFKSFGSDKTRKDAKDTRRDLEDVGKARANVAQWVRDVTSGTSEGARRANQGAAGVAKNLRDGTGKARANLAPFGQSLFSALSGFTNRAYGSAAGVGQNIAAGMSQGIAANAWQAVNAAGQMVTDAINEANRRADNHSPSRVMHKAGRDMGEGLARGIESKHTRNKHAGRKAADSIIEGFNEGSAGVAKVVGRLSDLIATTFAGRERSARRRIKNAHDERVALNHLAAAERARSKSLRHLDDALVKNGKAQDANNAALENARGKLREILQTSRDYAASIREAVTATGDVTTLGKDEAGTATAAGIIDQMTARVQAAKRYADLIATLTKAGLNKTSLQQILAAGVEGGLSTAEALAAGGASTIRQVNNLTAQLVASGTGLGDKAADTMHGAGIKAAEGLVKGLEDKEARIDKVARRLANTLANAVRRALRVHSPSRVFEDIGKRTVEGLQVGLDDTHVRRSGRKLAASLVDGFSDPKLTATAVLDATTGAGSGAPMVRVELTAAQVDALQRGRGIALDVDAFGSAGGRRVAKVVRR